MSEPITVVVADDQALLRGSFALLIDSCPDLAVVGEAGTGAEAVRLVQEKAPDLVLMDVRMPHMDGIEATRLICAPHPICATPDSTQARVVILTTFDLDEYVYAAIRAGASGFLLKDTPPADLLSALRTVAAGDALLAPSVTRRLIDEFARRPHPARNPSPELAKITHREREVLTLIGRGMNNHEIGDALHISLATTRTHVSHLLAKLQARDRAQLVIAAYETGLAIAHRPQR